MNIQQFGGLDMTNKRITAFCAYFVYIVLCVILVYVYVYLVVFVVFFLFCSISFSTLILLVGSFGL